MVITKIKVSYVYEGWGEPGSDDVIEIPSIWTPKIVSRHPE